MSDIMKATLIGIFCGAGGSIMLALWLFKVSYNIKISYPLRVATTILLAPFLSPLGPLLITLWLSRLMALPPRVADFSIYPIFILMTATLIYSIYRLRRGKVWDPVLHGYVLKDECGCKIK